MCGGPSDTQMKLQDEEAQFYAKQISAYDNAYSKFNEINSVLKKQFEPILARGSEQYGYSPGEDTALRTQAGEGTAQNFAQAQRALQQRIAAQGGGTSNVNITSGGSQDLQAQLAAEAAGEKSRENLGITASGYDVGRQLWSQAVAGEQGLAAGWNPNSFSGSTVNAGNAAASEANTITQQQQAVWGNVLGALGGVAGTAAGGWAGGGFKTPGSVSYNSGTSAPPTGLGGR